MKKGLFVLSLIVVLSFTGCSNDNSQLISTDSKYNEISENSVSSIETEKNINSVNTNKSNNHENFSETPDYFNKVVDDYNELAVKYNFNYEAPLSTSINKMKSDSSYSYEYNFSIKSLNDSSSCETVSIKEKLDGAIIQSFSAAFDSDFDNSTIKDFITATILLTDSDATYEDAEEKMQSLITSYSGETCSKLIESGNYILVMLPEYRISSYNVLYVQSKNEVNQKINLSDYKPGSFEDINSPLNASENIFLTITIDSVDTSSSNMINTINVSDENGNSFEIFLSYENFCIDFEIGKQYLVYGAITKSKGLRLEYVDTSLND